MANYDSALSALGERLAETDAVFSTSIVEIMTAAVQELVEVELTARSLLEPRRRIDKALWAVIMTADITGTSTRKVDDLVKALGCDSGSRSPRCLGSRRPPAPSKNGGSCTAA